MLKSLWQFRQASYETKFFVFTLFVYMAVLVGTTIYSYARLDSNRSAPIQTKTENKP